MTSSLSRRSFLAGGSGLAATLALSRWEKAFAATPSGLRQPNSVPDPGRPPGTPDAHLPIEHVVVVMMENHSFDNYLGLLSRRGQPASDGFAVDNSGRPTATNPTAGGAIRAFHMPTECQMEFSPSQAWTATLQSINGGAMNGFVKASGDVAMGYWDDRDLPFYYSLARTFALANRWFSSATVQTYPQRRFLMAGTAYSLIGSDLPGVNDPPPPNGTIFERLNHYGISWRDYFTDLPQIAIIPAAAKANLSHLAPIAQFYADAAAGTLPAVSLVDPDFGLADAIGSRLPFLPPPSQVNAQGSDEENPQNVEIGEQFVESVVNAVIHSPQWPKTLLVWLYDEHGGYYDHVPPPRAIPPDSIPPKLGPHDLPGRYDIYGIRVPAVVVSPWARAASVSNVVHDHTSILAFIEQKWNLPAMTYRDANAASLADFLDFRRPALLEPPTLSAAANALTAACSTADPHAPVERVAATSVTAAPSPGSSPPRPTLPATGAVSDVAGVGAALLGAGLIVRNRRGPARRPLVADADGHAVE